MPALLSPYGPIFILLGLALVGLDLIGASRAQRYREGLGDYLRDLVTPLRNPAYLLQTFMDLFYRRRVSFWFFTLAPLAVLPAYARWVYASFQWVRWYLDLLLSVWVVTLGFTGILILPAALLWLVASRRGRFPVWVDHLATAGAYPWRWALPVALPSAILFLAIPLAANLIVAKALLTLFYGATTFAVRAPLRLSRPKLRLLAVVLLAVGIALHVYASV